MVKIGKGGRTADTRAREVESGRCKLTGIPNRIKRKYVNPYILSGSLPGTRWISQSPLWAWNLTLFLLCLNSSWFSFSCWTMKRPSDWMMSRLVFLQLQESGIPVLRGRNIELVPLLCHQCLRDFSLMAITHFWLSFLLFPAFLVQNGSFTLVVNIKSKDGEIVQQTFSADPEKDFVTIDYKSNENRFVSVYIDFRQVCVKASLLKIFF